jgi:ribose 1,5-bisphosphokinase
LLLPVLLTVDGEVLRQRLIARGRESAADIEARLQRNQRFVAVTQAEAEAIEQVDNSGELATAVRRFLQILRRAGVSAVPGQI